MATGKFSKGEAIRFGWAKMADNLGFFIALLIVTGLISYIFRTILKTIVESTKESAPVIFLIFSLIFSVPQMIIGMGFIRITLKFADGLKGEFSDLFSCYPLFFKYLFGSILYLGGIFLVSIPFFIWTASFRFIDYEYLFGSILTRLIALGGTILLIIPAIIWAIRFQFYAYFIIDKEAGPIEALRRSLTITKGSTWNLFLFGLLFVAINLLGMLCLLIGLFVTGPITMVAVAFVYRRLQTLTEDAQIPELAQAPKVTQTPEVMTFLKSP